MLARASIEALIVGLYCLHEPNAVSQLQGENIRILPCCWSTCQTRR